MNNVPTPQPNPLIAWVSQYGQVTFFFVQIAFWVLIAGAAIFAAWQLKRLVDLRKAELGEIAIAEKPKAVAEESAVSVEDFVE